MPKSRRRCIFLLVLGGLNLVTGYVSISGCSGDSIILYRDISFESDNIVVYLYKNGDNNTLLAMWSKQNSDPIMETIENGYGKKVSLHNGNIHIHNLSKYDEGKYVIQHAIRSWKIILEVHLVVLRAPLKQCIPNITRVKNDLVASLDIEDCGNPAAHVSWYKLEASNKSRPLRGLKYPGKRKGTTISKIGVGKEAGKYFACAQSSAMHCARKVRHNDLCSYVEKEKDNILTTLPRWPKMTTWSELSDLTKRTTDIHAERLELPELVKGIIAALSIISVFAVVAVIVTSIILYRRCKAPSPATNQELHVDMPPPNSSEAPSPATNQELHVDTPPPNSSEAPSPATNQELHVDMLPPNSSEAPSSATNQELHVEMPPSNSSEAPSSATNQELHVEMPPSNSSEAPSPATNQELHVEMPPPNSSEAPSTSRNQESAEGKEISFEWDSMLNTEIKEPVAKHYVIPDM